MARDPLLEELLTAAREHGEEGEPEHEVGDLTALVEACWAHLTPTQRAEVHRTITTDRD